MYIATVENQDKIIKFIISRKVESDFEETKYPVIISIYCNDHYIIEHPLCTLTRFSVHYTSVFSYFNSNIVSKLVTSKEIIPHQMSVTH